MQLFGRDTGSAGCHKFFDVGLVNLGHEPEVYIMHTMMFLLTAMDARTCRRVSLQYWHFCTQKWFLSTQSLPAVLFPPDVLIIQWWCSSRYDNDNDNWDYHFWIIILGFYPTVCKSYNNAVLIKLLLYHVKESHNDPPAVPEALHCQP